MALEFTDKNFQEEVINSDVPVIVDFWATWCSPCQMMIPIIDDVAKEAGKTAKVGKINVDENAATAAKFNVMSIPTIMFFNKGTLVKQLIGVQSKDTLLEEIKNMSK